MEYRVSQTVFLVLMYVVLPCAQRVACCATGPYYFDNWVEERQVDYENGGLVTSNPNYQGSDIPWSLTTSNAATDEIEFSVSGTDGCIQAGFKGKTSGKTSFVYDMAGTVKAPARNEVNHHQAFLGYCAWITKEWQNWKYYTETTPDGPYVCDPEKKGLCIPARLL